MPEHLAGVKTTLQEIQDRVQRLLPPNAILVGHSLESDLKALKVRRFLSYTSLNFNA